MKSKYHNISLDNTLEIIPFNEYKIIRKICKTLGINEGKDINSRSKEKGAKILVTMTSIFNVVDSCNKGCGLNLKGDMIYWHSGQCSCSTFLVKHIACRHMFFLAREFRFQQQRKLGYFTPTDINYYILLSFVQPLENQTKQMNESVWHRDTYICSDDKTFLNESNIKVSDQPFSIGKAKSPFSTFNTKKTTAREEYI